MGARQRLNSLYLFGVLMAAAIVGGATQSWGLFFLVAIVLSGLMLHDGSIRPQALPRRRHRSRRR